MLCFDCIKIWRQTVVNTQTRTRQSLPHHPIKQSPTSFPKLSMERSIERQTADGSTAFRTVWTMRDGNIIARGRGEKAGKSFFPRWERTFSRSKTKNVCPPDGSPFSLSSFDFSRVSSISGRGWRSMTRRDATWRLDATMPDTCWRIVEGREKKMVRACEKEEDGGFSF